MISSVLITTASLSGSLFSPLLPSERTLLQCTIQGWGGGKWGDVGSVGGVRYRGMSSEGVEWPWGMKLVHYAFGNVWATLCIR